MSTQSPSIPQGIGHEPDLSAMTAPDRRKHHQSRLRSIALHQGLEGVAAYKALHPEAAALRIHSAPVAYSPKPKGYAAALISVVSCWLDSEAAQAQTNRADVTRLNELLGADFNPDTFFSKPLSGPVLAKLGELFAERGHTLPSSANTMSKVRKAAGAARAVGAGCGAPFAEIGTRVESQLVVGDARFSIERHNGHDCIRLSVEGARVRIRLDALASFIDQAGLRAGDPSHLLLRSRMGELAPDGQMPLEPDPLGAILPENHKRSDTPPPTLPEDLAPDPPAASLADRILALTASRQEQDPASHSGPDPLASI